jgi:hypothetical protein
MSQAAGQDKATADKMMQDSKAQVDEAKKWIGDFSKAGGKRIYIVVSIAGMFTGDQPICVAPVEAGADGAALAKALDPSKSKPPAPGADPSEANVAEVVGKSVVIGSKKSVEAAKTLKPAPRPELSQALAAGGTSTLRIAIAGQKLQSLPIPGFAQEPGVKGVEWIALAVATPPTESAALTVQCKDPQAAVAIANLMNNGLGALRANPQAKAELGDVEPLAKALTPATAGNKVTIMLDTKTIESVIAPLAIKLAAKQAVRERPASPRPGAGAASPGPGAGSPGQK